MQQCQAAAIRVLMITGDHARTGAAIAGKLGIAGAEHGALILLRKRVPREPTMLRSGESKAVPRVIVPLAETALSASAGAGGARRHGRRSIEGVSSLYRCLGSCPKLESAIPPMAGERRTATLAGSKEVMQMQKLANGLAALLVIVGALNWGLVAVAEFDLVAAVFGLDFGETNAASRIVYGLVGLAAIYGIWALLGTRRKVDLRPAPAGR